VDPGLYVTFFTEGEPLGRELPPVGPLEHLVVRDRDRSLIADRKLGEQADAFAGGGRWIEAELELRRATGREPGGPTRSALRIAAPEGVYLRFVAFDEGAEHEPLPELGPYAVVVVGRRGVEADGDPLATRAATNLWELTGVGGSAFVGVIRPDIAFRTRSTAYHPDIDRIRAVPQEAATAVTQPAAPAAPSPAQSRPAEEASLTLRDRIGSEPSTARLSKAVADDEQREWGGALWRLRYGIIGALVVLIIAFSIPSIRAFFSAVGSGGATVGIGTPVTSPDWTYNVGRVRRVTTIGAARANGTYLVVQIAATNRAQSGAQLLPTNFVLHAATGEQYPAQPTTSSVYSSAENPGSLFVWPTDFPVGRPILVPLIFEVNPSIDGTQLVIVDVPTTRIRLE
jgi:hypothetical protein